MKEQDAAHSFEKIPWGKQEDIDALNAELTRLRSELQHQKNINVELSKGLESAVDWVKREFPKKFDSAMKEFESLIKKAKTKS